MIHSELLLSCKPSHNFRVGPKHCCRQVLYRSRQCLLRLILCESNRQCDTTADRQPLLVSICLPEHSTRTNDRQWQDKAESAQQAPVMHRPEFYTLLPAQKLLMNRNALILLSNSKVRPDRATQGLYFELGLKPSSSSGSCPAVDKNGSNEFPSSSAVG